MFIVKKYFFLSLFFSLFSFEVNAFQGNVVKITDGDTLVLLTTEKNQIKVRLSEIDAPEKKQAFGKKSKQTLSKLCSGSKAILKNTAKDRYGRTLARVYCNNIDVNREMVRLGMAWVYDRYAIDSELYSLQKAARINKIGLWAEDNPVQPWVFRMKSRRR